MAASLQAADGIPQLVADARVVSYTNVAALALLVYEYASTFQDEATLFWPAPWSISKVLYLWNRYFALLFIPFNAYIETWPINSTFACTKILQVQGLGASVIIATVDAVLMLRVWILYEKNRRVLWFLLVAFSAEVITMLILSFYYDGPKFVHMEFMPIGCFAIGGRRHWTIFAIAPLTVSLIMFGMTMYRCRKTLRVSQGVGMPLFQLFLRDGILYFIAASPVLIAGLFMWRFARSTLSESLVGLANTLYSMVTSRVLINIRTAVIEKTRRLTHTSAFDLMVLDISDGSVTMAENPPPRILCKDGADTA